MSLLFQTENVWAKMSKCRESNQTVLMKRSLLGQLKKLYHGTFQVPNVTNQEAGGGWGGGGLGCAAPGDLEKPWDQRGTKVA